MLASKLVYAALALQLHRNAVQESAEQCMEVDDGCSFASRFRQFLISSGMTRVVPRFEKLYSNHPQLFEQLGTDDETWLQEVILQKSDAEAAFEEMFRRLSLKD